jgi:hypothetical protein
MIGMDNKTYPVFTLFASGRGWAAKQYFTPRANWVNFMPTVRVLTDTFYKDVRNCVPVDIVEGHDMLVNVFNKRPYVRKDGTFTVIDDEDYYPGCAELGNKYGVTKIDSSSWNPIKGLSTVSYMDDFHKNDIELDLVKRGQKYYLTNIIVKKGTLVPFFPPSRMGRV